HKRSCPVCGPYWKLKTYRRFGYHVFAHDGELYADQVLDLDWPATVKEMRRRAKKLGVPLRYVAIRNVDNMLTVIASVYPGEVARPVEKGEALDLLKRAVDTASLEPRPVNSCREWRPLDKPEVERVSGGCSPSAFHATLKTWGATAEGGGSRFIKCDIPNLFLSVDKTLDTVKEADFWHEAWLRDTAGGVEADSFHVRAVEQRARVKAVVTCQHPPDQVKELPTFDGFVNRQCGVCGQWFPCRYAFTPARQNAAEGQIALATAETV
ncbi:MAG: hypothetical protein KKE86_07845, partial [Planctomycetes bacterium]|nr:hypothetical protein [Planctomycetota bacterium]